MAAGADAFQGHFSVITYDYNSPGNAQWRTVNKSINPAWAHFEELGENDPKRADGMNSVIRYYEGGQAQNPELYYVTQTIYELNALANDQAIST